MLDEEPDDRDASDVDDRRDQDIEELQLDGDLVAAEENRSRKDGDEEEEKYVSDERRNSDAQFLHVTYSIRPFRSGLIDSPQLRPRGRDRNCCESLVFFVRLRGLP